MTNIEIGEVFTISDDDGQEFEVEVLAALNIEGTTYGAVAFVEDLQEGEEGDIDIFFIKIDKEGDLAAIESDEEFEKVSAAFDEIMENEE